MAFAKKSDQAPTVQRGNFEKAQGFLNVSIRMGNGKLKQIGGIALRESVELHRKLLAETDISDLVLECDLHLVENSDEPLEFAKRSA